MRRLGDRLLLAAVLAAPLASACDDTLLDPMMNDQKYKPYEANEFYPDLRAMRTPPEGTVPRERKLGDVGFNTGRVEARDVPPFAPFVTTIPIKVTRDTLEQGRKRYNITCATCHGLLGDGDTVVAGKMSLKPPPSLHLRPEPGYFFEIITFGHGMMASYAAEIPIEERWAVVAYIKALQLSQRAPVDQLPPEMRGQVERESH